jgi:hypothetical protein
MRPWASDASALSPVADALDTLDVAIGTKAVPRSSVRTTCPCAPWTDCRACQVGRSSLVERCGEMATDVECPAQFLIVIARLSGKAYGESVLA